MLELYILGGFLLIVIAVIPLYFVGAALYQRKQNKENANKKKVYVNTLVITYCGVGTELMNKKYLTYRSDTYEEAMKSRKRLIDIANKAHQTLATLSDNDIFNFEGIVVIHKNQFIAIEQGTYTEYE
jgi:ABC-type transport system involved in cytochrome bd biosynthesis fused ATPase/permease subunit